MKEKSVEMRLLICLLVLAYWEQIIAPQVEPCQVEGTTRLFTAATHPQLCYSIEESLQWSYFCGNFRMREGKIFCKSLGYPSYQSDGGVSSNTIGGQAKITNLDCKGNETKLTDCSFTETTNECMVAIGLVCVACSSNSVCGQNGQCTQNGTCVCREACENGGYCFAGRCICPEGFGGPICNECDPPCLYTGVCYCVNGHYGSNCQLSASSTNSTTTTSTAVPTGILGLNIGYPLYLTLVIPSVAVSACIVCHLCVLCCIPAMLCCRRCGKRKSKTDRKAFRSSRMIENRSDLDLHAVTNLENRHISVLHDYTEMTIPNRIEPSSVLESYQEMNNVLAGPSPPTRPLHKAIAPNPSSNLVTDHYYQ